MRAAIFVMFVTLVVPRCAFAQMTGSPDGYKIEPGQPASAVPAALREIGFDQHLSERLPLDTEFFDESGRKLPLSSYFGSRPVVLTFVYYQCPMLCTQVLNGLTSALGVLTLDVGKDFDVVTISIDPREKPAMAAAKKTTYLERYRRPTAAAGWHFLTGDEASIKRVTQAAGFRYVWDDQLKQFAHPTGVIVATADGTIARYLFGIEYGPRDLRFALVDASNGKVGNPVDTLLLYCYHYDPMTGKYGFLVLRAMRIAGAATVLLLVGFIAMMLRLERRARARTQHPASRNQHPAPGTL